MYVEFLTAVCTLHIVDCFALILSKGKIKMPEWEKLFFPPECPSIAVTPAADGGEPISAFGSAACVAPFLLRGGGGCVGVVVRREKGGNCRQNVWRGRRRRRISPRQEMPEDFSIPADDDGEEGCEKKNPRGRTRYT